MKSSKKTWIIFISILAVILGIIFIPRIVTKNRAISYFQERFGKVRDVESLEITGVRANLFSGTYQAQAVVDGVAFTIDLPAYRDDYVERYTEQFYQRLLRENYDGNDIQAMSVPSVDESRHSYVDLDKKDVGFYLEVYFVEDINTKELLAERTIAIIRAIKEAELTECITLTTSTRVGNGNLYLQVTPFLKEYRAEDLLPLAKTSPLED